MVVRQLIISLDERGTVTVEGPLEDKVLCYGLLAFARDQVQQFQPKAVQAVPVIPPQLKRGP